MSKLKDRLRARTAKDNGNGKGKDESGAVLILAIVYLIAVIIVVTSLAGWVTNDLNNTAHFSEASSTHLALSGTMDVAIASIRTTPLLSETQAQNTPSPLSYCWTPASGTVSEETLDNYTAAVWCSTVEDLSQSNTRVVTLYACSAALTGAQCQANPTLEAVVTFDDYPPGGSAPLTKQCTTWCGQGMFMQSWVWE